MNIQRPLDLTPTEFEKAVKKFIEDSGITLIDFDAQHSEIVKGMDNDYQIDVTARFEALGVNFLVLIECKRYTSSIKRERVELLHNRIVATGAQKGMLFATSDFQSGAIAFAEKHGIALVKVSDGKLAYLNKDDQEPTHRLEFLPDYAGFLIYPNNRQIRIGELNPEALIDWLMTNK